MYNTKYECRYNNDLETDIKETEQQETDKQETDIILNDVTINIDDIKLIKSKITSIIEQVSSTYPINFKNILKKFNLSKYNLLINQIYKTFNKKKKQENTIDFNDLMVQFCDFLKSSKSQ